MSKIKKIIIIAFSFFGFLCLLVLGCLLFLILKEKIDENNARKEGYLIPTILNENDTHKIEKKIYLKDPLPEKSWTEGYLFGPYLSAAPLIEKKTGQKCKIYHHFCEGTVFEQQMTMVLFYENELVGAFWVDDLNFKCNLKSSTFTKENPILCLHMK